MAIAAPNYTQIPNIFIDDWLDKLSGLQVKILLIICRKTIGWHKLTDKISLSQLMKLTKAARDKICDAVKSLVDFGLIIKEVTGIGRNATTFYEINIQEQINGSQKLPSNGSQKLPTKERGIKERKETKGKKTANASPSASPSPSAHASELSLFLLSSIREKKPDFKQPNLKRWDLEFGRMLKIDKRGSSRLKELILWATGHSFWASNILSPMALRKHFDKLDMQSKEPAHNDGADKIPFNHNSMKKYDSLVNDTKTYQINVFNKCIEFTPLSSGSPSQIEYSDYKFQEKFKRMLEAYGFMT